MIFSIVFFLFFHSINANCDFILHRIDGNNRHELIDKNLSSLHVFNYKSLPLSIFNSWHVASVSITDLHFDDIDFFYGANETTVKNLCQTSFMNYKYFDSVLNKLRHFVFGSKKNSVNFDLNPFDDMSFGIKLKRDKRFRIKIDTKFNPIFFVLTVVSIGLFFLSRKLAESVVFHVSCCVLINLLASSVIILFLLSRILPFRRAFYAIGVIGSSIFVPFFVYLKDEIFSLVEHHLFAVVIYVLIVTFFTSIILYYYYPERVNVKVVNIIDLCLKLVAVLLLWVSVSIWTSFCVLLTIILLIYLSGNRWVNPVRCYFLYWFPRKRVYISPDEYPKILEENTNQELQNFRNYLKSPECDVWKVLKNSSNVNSLIEFANSGCHVSEREINDYNSSEGDLELSFESDSSIEFDAQTQSMY